MVAWPAVADVGIVCGTAGLPCPTANATPRQNTSNMCVLTSHPDCRLAGSGSIRALRALQADLPGRVSTAVNIGSSLKLLRPVELDPPELAGIGVGGMAWAKTAVS